MFSAFRRARTRRDVAIDAALTVAVIALAVFALWGLEPRERAYPGLDAAGRSNLFGDQVREMR